MDGNALSFLADPAEPPEIEIRVNFGTFAGRDATVAEVDDLARDLLGVLHRVSIESLRRHELDQGHEASIHQVVVQAATADAVEPTSRDVLAGRLLDRVDAWARRCIELRHVEGAGIDALR
jgi:hypothetical protein